MIMILSAQGHIWQKKAYENIQKENVLILLLKETYGMQDWVL